jgi:GPN-loop GTPase
MASSASSTAQQPVAIVTIGMAGSGKTTFMQRITNHLHTTNQKPYTLNLDPAVLKVPFAPNIDIRDSINYKEVMKQYNLGPNGGILTSLNLFATKIDQIISLLEKRANPPPDSNIAPPKHILVDTPGQIEVLSSSNPSPPPSQPSSHMSSTRRAPLRRVPSCPICSTRARFFTRPNCL